MQTKLRTAMSYLGKLMLLSIFTLLTSLAFAQEKTTFTGLVTDQDGKPIANANVTTKDQRYGTRTDEDGKFSLTTPKTTSRNLVISCAGYRSTEIRTGANTNFTVKLIKSNQDLDAVTIVGYGTKKKADLSGAVVEVGSEFITNQAITSVDQGLAGLVPGVTLREGSGAPGSGPEILIRGINGFGRNRPLIVIDDVIFEDVNDDPSNPSPSTQLQNPLALINPEDIASVVILKDAASKAIYGSRATAGVILITTKKGYGGKAKISFTHNLSFTNILGFEKPDVLNATELAQYRKERAIDELRLSNNPSYAIYADPKVAIPDNVLLAFKPSASAYINPEIYGAGTNWFEAITQQGITNNSNISVTGGNQNLKYFLSANYLDQESVMKFNGIKRYSLRGSMDVKITDKIKLGLMFNPTRTEALRPADEPSQAGFSIYNTLNTASWLDPSAPLYQADGRTLTYVLKGKITDSSYFTSNPLYQLTAELDKRRSTQVNTSTYIEFEPIKNLTIRSQINFAYTQNVNQTFLPSTLVTDAQQPVFPAADSGRASLANITTNNFINDNIIRYKIKKRRHNVNFMLGYNIQQNTRENSRVNVIKILNEDFIIPASNNTSLSAIGNANFTSAYNRVRFLSQIGRINYNFGDKYLVDFSLRRDASSRFGREVRYGNFPAGSVAWRVTEENFVKKANIGWLDELRLEAGWGKTGNADVGNFAAQGTLGVSNYTFGNTNSLGYAINSPANAEVTWEKADQTDLGLNASFLKRKISVAFNWFKQVTTDPLASSPYSFITGFGSGQYNQPQGKIENKGYELSVDFAIKRTKNFRWTVGTNLSRYRNKLVSYYLPGGFAVGQAGNGQTVALTSVGNPFGMLRGLQLLGLYTAADLADPSVIKYPNARVGDIKYADGNGDGKLDITNANTIWNDNVILGSPHPDFSFGFNTQISYKNVNLRAVFAGQKGGLIMDLRREFMWNGDGPFNVDRQVLNRWRPGDDPTTKAFGGTTRFAGNSFEQTLGRIPSSNKVYDGSYLALKNLTIGYNLTKAINKKRRLVESLELSVTMRNVFYLASYKYGNPEVRRANDGSALRSINYGSFPVGRTTGLTLNLQF
jgi:TonB-dependent starch-binding outer membrane protein SusC